MFDVNKGIKEGMNRRIYGSGSECHNTPMHIEDVRSGA